MNSSDETGSTNRRSDHPRARGAWKALLWLVVLAVALAPYPW
jgi:hypothetical protein